MTGAAGVCCSVLYKKEECQGGNGRKEGRKIKEKKQEEWGNEGKGGEEEGIEKVKVGELLKNKGLLVQGRKKEEMKGRNKGSGEEMKEEYSIGSSKLFFWRGVISRRCVLTL